MTDRPVLFASYSGVLGGAERVLLDCVTRLERPVAVACPEGPLADALRAAGIAHVRRSPSGRCGSGLRHAARDLFGLARELAAARSRASLVAWGARGRCSPRRCSRRAAAVARRPPRPACSPAPRAPCAPRRAAPTASLAASHAIARAARRRRRGPPPRRRPRRVHPAPAPGRPAARARARRARRLEAPGPRARDRRAGCRSCTSRSPASRCPATTADRGASCGAARRARRPRDVRRRRRRRPRPRWPSAHVLLHCADAEPYGLVLVEALAAGRPVVAPATAGPLEIVTGRRRPPLPARRRRRRRRRAARGARRPRGPRRRPPPRRGGVRRPRLGRRARRGDRRGDRPMTATSPSSIVLHRSRDELARAAGRRCRAARGSSSSTPAPTTAARSSPQPTAPR